MIYDRKTSYGREYGISVERDGKIMRLMQILDGGGLPGDNLLIGVYYATASLKTAENEEKKYLDFENTGNERCFFWKVEGDKEETRKNFDVACKHYREIYGGGKKKCV